MSKFFLKQKIKNWNLLHDSELRVIDRRNSEHDKDLTSAVSIIRQSKRSLIQVIFCVCVYECVVYVRQYLSNGKSISDT